MWQFMFSLGFRREPWPCNTGPVQISSARKNMKKKKSFFEWSNKDSIFNAKLLAFMNMNSIRLILNTNFGKYLIPLIPRHCYPHHHPHWSSTFSFVQILKFWHRRKWWVVQNLVRSSREVQGGMTHPRILMVSTSLEVV